jgi:hypothetical protein
MHRLFTWTAMSVGAGSLLALSMAAAQPAPQTVPQPTAQKAPPAPIPSQIAKPLPPNAIPSPKQQGAPATSGGAGGTSAPPSAPVLKTFIGHWTLGITMSPVPDLLVYHLRRLLPPKHGVLVAMVEAGSGAERAGLRRGDVILSCDHHAIDTPEQLIGYVQAKGEANKPVRLDLIAQQMASGRAAHCSALAWFSVTLTVIQAGELRTIELAAEYCWLVPQPSVASVFINALSINVRTGHGSVSLVGVDKRLTLAADFVDSAGHPRHLEKTGALAGILPEIEKLPHELADIIKSRLPAGAVVEKR